MTIYQTGFKDRQLLSVDQVDGFLYLLFENSVQILDFSNDLQPTLVNEVKNLACMQSLYIMSSENIGFCVRKQVMGAEFDEYRITLMNLTEKS